MSIANEHADKFYFPHFQFKDSVNATYIIAFWDQTPCTLMGDINLSKLYLCIYFTSVALQMEQVWLYLVLKYSNITRKARCSQA